MCIKLVKTYFLINNPIFIVILLCNFDPTQSISVVNVFNKTNEESLSEVPTIISSSSNSTKDEPKLSSNQTQRNGLLHHNFTYCDTKPKFIIGSGSLLTHMLRLKLCQVTANKPWFERACKRQLYGRIAGYYQAVYNRFCQPDLYWKRCGETSNVHADEPLVIVLQWMKVHKIPIDGNFLEEQSNQMRNNSFTGFKEVTTKIQTADCKAINSYFAVLSTQKYRSARSDYLSVINETKKPFQNVQYSEWFLMYRAFCEPIACGISYQNYQNYSLSAYECFPSSCRTAIVALMVFDSVLAFIIVVANLLVLAVAIRTKIMRNIPGYFKVSLAVADLMIGLFVLPGNVYNHYVLSIGPLPFRDEGQKPLATDYFDQRYLDFMGVFTVLSFAVSIFTMGAASVDRYLAITKPFKYRKGVYLNRRRLVVILLLIWMAGFTCAIYPIFTSHQYNISALGLVLSTGIIATVVYAITLGFPLLAVWLINGLMLYQVLSESKHRKNLSISHKRATPTNSIKKDDTKEQRHFSRKSQSSCKSRRDSGITDDDVFDLNSNKDYSKKHNMRSKRTFSTSSYGTNFRESVFSRFTSSVQSRIKQRFRRGTNASMTQQANVERRMATTLGVMVGAFTIALLPSIFVLAALPLLTTLISPRHYPSSYDSTAMNTYTSSEFIASRLLLSNSFWNCIIYSIRNRHFRKALRYVFIFSKERRRQRRRNDAVNSIASRTSRGRHLSKMSSTDSGCVVNGLGERNRKPTESSYFPCMA